jgi:hypothetical protein
MAKKCARTFSIVVEKGKKSILDVGHLLPDALPRSVRRAFCTRHPFTCRRRAAAALHLTSRAPQQVWTPSRQRWVESVSWTSTPKCANSPRPVTRRSGLRPPRTCAGAVGCYQAAAAWVAQLRRLVSPVLPSAGPVCSTWTGTGVHVGTACC